MIDTRDTVEAGTNRVGTAWWGWPVRAAFAACVLTLLLRRIDMSGVLAALRLANGWSVPAGIALFLATQYIWAYQRSLGLGPIRAQFTVAQLLKIILVSTFYSLVFPGHMLAAGVASWSKLRRGTPRGGDALALLVYFQLVNTVTLLGIGLIGMWCDSRLSSAGVRAGIAAAFGALAVASTPLFSSRAAGGLARRAGPAVSRLPLPRGIRSVSKRGWQAITAFNTLPKRVIVLGFGLSLLAHFVGILLHYLLAHAVGISLPLSVIGWVRSLTGIAQLVPVSIAGLGVREASLVLLLGAYDVPEAQALSLSLLVFAVTLIWGMVGGLLEGWDALTRLVRSRRAAHLPVVIVDTDIPPGHGGPASAERISRGLDLSSRAAKLGAEPVEP